MLLAMLIQHAMPMQGALMQDTAAVCPLSARWGSGEPDPTRRHNAVSIDRGKAMWNGIPVSDATLNDYAKWVTASPPRPTLTLHRSGASCAEIQRIAAAIEFDGDCKPTICTVSDAVAPAPTRDVPTSKAWVDLTRRSAPSPKPINPGSWVTYSDYPAPAMRANESGTVVFRLDVDETGHTTNCTVTHSSGSAMLDATSCALLKQRATFEPARDGAGHPVASRYANRFRWVLPVDTMTSWSTVRRVTLGKEGEILSCKEVPYGPASDKWKIGCQWLATVPQANLKAFRGTSTGRVTIVMRYDHIVQGVPGPDVPTLPAKFKTVATQRVRMDIGEDGRPVACFVDGGRGEVAIPSSICQQMASYVPGTGKRSVTGVNSLLTDGDPDVAAALGGLTAPPVAQ